MKNIFLIIPVMAFFLTTSLSAQVNDGGGHGMMLVNTKNTELDNEVIGSYYLDENFKPGKVVIKGYSPLDVLMRYNVNTETFEMKMDAGSDETYVLPLKPDTKYYLDTTPYSYRTVNSEGKTITGYFKNLYDGEKISFLEKPTLSMSEAVAARTGYGKDKPAEINLQREYFLVFQDGTTRPVTLKKKDFQRALPSTPEVKNYLSDNKLRSVEDFAKMIEWYDNLQ